MKTCTLTGLGLGLLGLGWGPRMTRLALACPHAKARPDAQATKVWGSVAAPVSASRALLEPAQLAHACRASEHSLPPCCPGCRSCQLALDGHRASEQGLGSMTQGCKSLRSPRSRGLRRTFKGWPKKSCDTQLEHVQQKVMKVSAVQLK